MRSANALLLEDVPCAHINISYCSPRSPPRCVVGSAATSEAQVHGRAVVRRRRRRRVLPPLLPSVLLQRVLRPVVRLPVSLPVSAAVPVRLSRLRAGRLGPPRREAEGSRGLRRRLLRRRGRRFRRHLPAAAGRTGRTRDRTVARLATTRSVRRSTCRRTTPSKSNIRWSALGSGQAPEPKPQPIAPPPTRATSRRCSRARGSQWAAGR